MDFAPICDRIATKSAADDSTKIKKKLSIDWKYVDARYVRIDGAVISKPIFSTILNLPYSDRR